MSVFPTMDDITKMVNEHAAPHVAQGEIDRLRKLNASLLDLARNILGSQKDGTWETDCEWFAEKARAVIKAAREAKS